MKSIGIDIGSHSIKLIEIQTTNKGFIITRAAEKFLSLKTHQDQDIEIIELIREMTAGEDAQSTRFCLGLPQERVVTRHKTFPFRDRMKIAKSLPFELEEDIPFNSDNAIFDAKIIKTVDATAEVLAAAVTKNHIVQLLQRAQDGGIDPYLISAEGMAFANVFESWADAPPHEVGNTALMDETVTSASRRLRVVLNIGYNKTLVAAFDRDRLVAIRSILWGGKQVADAIAKKYELPFLEAKKEMELKGFILPSKNNASFDAKIFSDTISKSVREIVRDLQLSFLEIKTEFQADINEIYLTGGFSSLRGLGPFLTQNLDLPVNLIAIYDRFPQILFSRTDHAEERFSVAIGLALEGIKKPRNPPLQFLRQEFVRQNNVLKTFVDFWGPTLVTAASFIVLLLVYTFVRNTWATESQVIAEENLKDQAVQVAKIPKRSATRGGVQKFIKDTRKRSSDIRVLSSVVQMNSAMDILRTVSDSVPAKTGVTLDVHTFRVIDAQVEMHGYVKNDNEVKSLQNELRKISADGKINIIDPQLPAQSDRTAFSVSFRADRNIQSARQ